MNKHSIRPKMSVYREMACGIMLVLIFLSSYAIAAEVKIREAERLMDRAKIAAGGDAWNNVGTVDIFYTEYANGAPHDGEEKIDLRNGHISRMAKWAFPRGWGWNGSQAWSTQSGNLQIEKMDKTTASAIYAARLGYWFGHVEKSKMSVASHEKYLGTNFTVVRIIPEGGAALDFWINDVTARIERLQQYDEHKVKIDEVNYADFRQVGDVVIPFERRVPTENPDISVVTKVTRVVLNDPIGEEVFSPPVEPKIQGFHPGRESVDILFQLCRKLICIDVELNRKGPFRFALDTGGTNFMTPETLKKLGLETEGEVSLHGFSSNADQAAMTQVDLVELDGLALRDQRFAVAALPRDTGIDGFIGYEWLKNCAVRIDFAAQKLTFYDSEQFKYDGPGKPLPIIWTSTPPKPGIGAVIDGIPGIFLLDTGADSSVIIPDHFAKKFDSAKQFGDAKQSPGGFGFGGGYPTLVTHARVLQIGELAIREPTLSIAAAQTGGVFSDKNLAGDIGYGVLRRFNLVFDYPRNTVYFEPNKYFDDSDR